jgi:broad specificity phosphatase PhoE
MTIILARHGEIASTSDPHSHHTVPVEGCLSATGLKQAVLLQERLLPHRIDYIVSSPLGRALQTAQTVAEPRELPIAIADWLIEWQPSSSLRQDSTKYESIMREAVKFRLEDLCNTELGESTLQMAERVLPPFRKLLKSVGITPGHGGFLLDPNTDEKCLAIFAHGGTLNVIIRYLLDLPPSPRPTVFIPTGGYVLFKFGTLGDVSYPVLQIQN